MCIGVYTRTIRILIYINKTSMVIVLLTFKYFTQHVLNDNLMYCDLEGVDNCTSIIFYYLLPLLYTKLFRTKGLTGTVQKQ